MPPKQIIVPGDPGAYKRRKTEESDPAPQRAHFPRNVTEQPDPDERRKCIRQHRQSAKRVDGERDPSAAPDDWVRARLRAQQRVDADRRQHRDEAHFLKCRVVHDIVRIDGRQRCRKERGALPE